MINFIIHRINTISELKNIPERYGVEIDLRWNNGEIVLSHDPCEVQKQYDSLRKYLSDFKHKMLIVNIKETGIEDQVVKLLEEFSILNYFFLDLQFPVIVKLLNKGNSNIAIRYSEYEGLEVFNRLDLSPKYLWLDCFTKYPETTNMEKLRANGLKVCAVSPELQGHDFSLHDSLDLSQIDFICCKLDLVDRWSSK